MIVRQTRPDPYRETRMWPCRSGTQFAWAARDELPRRLARRANLDRDDLARRVLSAVAEYQPILSGQIAARLDTDVRQVERALRRLLAAGYVDVGRVPTFRPRRDLPVAWRLGARFTAALAAHSTLLRADVSEPPSCALSVRSSILAVEAGLLIEAGCPGVVRADGELYGHSAYLFGDLAVAKNSADGVIHLRDGSRLALELDRTQPRPNKCRNWIRNMIAWECDGDGSAFAVLHVVAPDPLALPWGTAADAIGLLRRDAWLPALAQLEADPDVDPAALERARQRVYVVTWDDLFSPPATSALTYLRVRRLDDPLSPVHVQAVAS